MFELIDLPNLKELNLSQNSIQEINYNHFKYVKSSLQLLDLSYNVINFTDVNAFFACFSNMGNYMKSLIMLNLINNPFTRIPKYRENYQNFILASFKNLQYLNGRDITMSQQDKEELNLKFIKERMLLMEEAEGSLSTAPINRNRNVQKVTLKEINDMMLRMNQYDMMNEKSINQLEEKIRIAN